MLTRPALSFPWSDPPAPGEPREVAPGLLWIRLPLPFRLDHVNIYLIEDEGGWAVIDTGLATDDTKQLWETLFTGPLAGRRLTRIVATHFHPDHVGLAGWLTERTGAPLSMSRTEFLLALAMGHRAVAPNPGFYTARGLDDSQAAAIAGMGHGYLRRTTGLPADYHRLVAGETLAIGGRRFTILTGGGHAPEQVMLHEPSETLLLAADQVLPRITPNISVHGMEPEGDPLGEFLASVASLRDTIGDEALVLPGHHLPFHGLGTRADELVAHHAARCDLITAATRDRALTPAELMPLLFRADLDPHQMGFAFSEIMAHVNYLRRRGRLIETDGGDGRRRYATS